MKQRMRRIVSTLIAGITGFGLVLSSATATDFSGKTIEWIIPFSETGGSAKWANFFAPLLSEELPGDPTVVVKFMPGAGSTKGANWFQNQRHKDGTLLFGSSGSTQFPYLLGDKRVRYEYGDWNPVMASGTGGVAYLKPEDGKDFDGSANKLQGRKFIYGAQRATGLDLIPLLAWKMLGLDVEPVFGIKGRGDGLLMFERGEANIDYQTSSSYLSKAMPLVKEGKGIAMMSWGALDADGNIVRDPTFPDIPTFKEVCVATSGCETSGEAWDAWKAFFISGFPVQKLAFLPAGTPRDVIDTYSTAFQRVIDRGDFPQISTKRVGKYKVFIGDDAKSSLDVATSVPASAKQFVVNWLKSDYNVSVQ